MQKHWLLCGLLPLMLSVNSVSAGNDRSSNVKVNDCSISFNDMHVDDEFGEGVYELTRCLKNTQHIQLVMQVNQSCRDTTIVEDSASGYKLENHPKSCDPGRGYGIAQMKNMINDYVGTHGMSPDRLDLKIIVHGGGGLMLLDDAEVPWTNNLQPVVEELMDKGVKFYFCMNTLRGLAKKLPFVADTEDLTSRVIPGVEFVTGGLTALADFQKQGYSYIQP